MLKVTGSGYDYHLHVLEPKQKPTLTSTKYMGCEILCYKSFNPRQTRWGGQINGPGFFSTFGGLFRWSAMWEARQIIRKSLGRS